MKLRIVLTFFLCACDCESDRVTFGLGARSAVTAPETIAEQAQEDKTTDLNENQVVRFDPPVTTIAVGGRPFGAQGEPITEALGLREQGAALAVMHGPTGAQLVHVVATEQAHKSQVLADWQAALGCAPASVHMERLDKDWIHTAVTSCEQQGDAPTRVSHQLWNEGRRVSARLSIVVRDGHPGRFVARDLDQDGHADVQFTYGDPPHTLAAAWLNAPGGLVYQRDHVTQSAQQLMTDLIDGDSHLAPSRAHAVVSGLTEHLCTGSAGSSRVWLNDKRAGLPCDIATIERALRKHVRQPVASAWVGPTLQPANVRGPRMSRFGFLSDDTLLIRVAHGPSPADGPVTIETRPRVVAFLPPPEIAPDDPPRVTGFRRGRQGVLMTLRHYSVPLRTLPITPKDHPLRDQLGVKSVVPLAWARQGMVLWAERHLIVVSLNGQGQAITEPTVLAPGEGMPPSPVPAGGLSPKGGHWIVTTKDGLMVGHHPRGTWRLVVPEGWKHDLSTASDVAVNPGGTRIAYMTQGKLAVATLPKE